VKVDLWADVTVLLSAELSADVLVDVKAAPWGEKKAGKMVG